MFLGAVWVQYSFKYGPTLQDTQDQKETLSLTNDTRDGGMRMSLTTQKHVEAGEQDHLLSIISLGCGVKHHHANMFESTRDYMVKLSHDLSHVSNRSGGPRMTHNRPFKVCRFGDGSERDGSADVLGMQTMPVLSGLQVTLGPRLTPSR